VPRSTHRRLLPGDRRPHRGGPPEAAAAARPRGLSAHAGGSCCDARFCGSRQRRAVRLGARAARGRAVRDAVAGARRRVRRARRSLTADRLTHALGLPRGASFPLNSAVAPVPSCRRPPRPRPASNPPRARGRSARSEENPPAAPRARHRPASRPAAAAPMAAAAASQLPRRIIKVRPAPCARPRSAPAPAPGACSRRAAPPQETQRLLSEPGRRRGRGLGPASGVDRAPLAWSLSRCLL
jgi:hypothetical protein